jgi:hypothetical protein
MFHNLYVFIPIVHSAYCNSVCNWYYLGVDKYGPRFNLIERYCQFNTKRSAKTLKQKYQSIMKVYVLFQTKNFLQAMFSNNLNQQDIFCSCVCSCVHVLKWDIWLCRVYVCNKQLYILYISIYCSVILRIFSGCRENRKETIYCSRRTEHKRRCVEIWLQMEKYPRSLQV